MSEQNIQTSGAQWFVQTFYPFALEAEKQSGISAIFTLAQAALESGWGSKTTGDFNYWGIKADPSWKGAFKLVSTHEVIKGMRVEIKAKFRSYSNATEAFKDHSQFFFTNPRYKKALESKSNPYSFANGIAAAGYATNPNYAEDLTGMINSVKKRLPI